MSVSIPLKQALEQLSTALQALHKELLMLEAKTLESESGRKLNPYELLNASLNDPKLSWLRSLSALIVQIDTIVDEAENLSGKESNEISSLVLALLEKPEAHQPQHFWLKYSAYLSHQPDVIMRHSKVKDLVSKLRPMM
jgi:hypothetical protein